MRYDNSVCLSVLLVIHAKTGKDLITNSFPHDSPPRHSRFVRPNVVEIIQREPLPFPGGRGVGYGKSNVCDIYTAISRKQLITAFHYK